MRSASQLRRDARGVVRRHYVTLVVAALLAVFVGSGAGTARELLRQNSAAEVYADMPVNALGSGGAAGAAERILASHFPGALAWIQGKLSALSALVPSWPAEKGLSGFCSTLLDALFSGELLVKLLETISGIVSEVPLTVRALLIPAFLIYGLLWVFFFNVIPAAVDRMVLETRVRRKVPLSRMLYFHEAGQWRNVALVMLRVKLQQFAWNLTLVGGIIKRFSYLAVPYIVAENPAVSPKEAVALSRRMMDGHKMEAFRFMLSYLGWRIFGIITLGIGEFLWSGPYFRAGMAEYYADLRADARRRRIAGMELLDENALFDGSAWAPTAEKKLPGKKADAEEALTCLGKRLGYEPFEMILLFFAFSMAGWLWEVSLHLIEQHQFVNRGFLHGPWLPIYGIGGILIALALRPFRDRPGKEFLLAVCVAGVTEYSIARYLELGSYHARYWDYHSMLMNLDGRICAESLLTFGVMGLLLVYVIVPVLTARMDWMPRRILMFTSIVLLLLFASDCAYSTAHPNDGSGVAVDITAGAWPTTFEHPDHLRINGVMVYDKEEALEAEAETEAEH